MDSKVLKNSVWLLSAQTIVKIISFGYTIFLASNLGTVNFGYYVTALVYFSLISSISDFGLNRFLIRESAKDDKTLDSLIGGTALIRFFLTSFLVGLFFLWINMVDQDFLRVNLSVLAVIAVLPQSLALTFDAVFIAKQKLFYSALALLVLSVMTVGSGIYLVSQGGGVKAATVSLIVGEISYALILVLFLINLKVKVSLDKINIFTIIKGSLPYAILGILGLLYFKIDALMLSYLKGPYSVGIYGAAYRFLEAIVFIPSALATALFPVISRLHYQNPEQIRNIYFSALKFLGLLSLGVLGAYIIILPQIIQALLPQYLPSISAIRILALTIPFIFLHVPGAMVLLSSEKFLKPIMLLSILTLTFNITLNLILIPSLDFVGASIATVCSEALSFIVFFILLYTKVLRK